MKKQQPEVMISMNTFFDETERATEMYQAVLELTMEMLNNTNNFSFIMDDNNDCSKAVFSSELTSVTFYNVKSATRMVIFESNIIKDNHEYTKKLTTIRNNYDESFSIDYESYNGLTPYTINSIETDINLNKINEKVLQKTL